MINRKVSRGIDTDREFFHNSSSTRWYHRFIVLLLVASSFAILIFKNRWKDCFNSILDDGFLIAHWCGKWCILSVRWVSMTIKTVIARYSLYYLRYYYRINFSFEFIFMISLHLLRWSNCSPCLHFSKLEITERFLLPVIFNAPLVRLSEFIGVWVTLDKGQPLTKIRWIKSTTNTVFQ